jgi:hypothetical protein
MASELVVAYEVYLSFDNVPLDEGYREDEVWFYIDWREASARIRRCVHTMHPEACVMLHKRM